MRTYQRPLAQPELQVRRGQRGFVYNHKWVPALGGGATADTGTYDTRDLITADSIPYRELFNEIDDMLVDAGEKRDRVSALFVDEVTDYAVRIYQMNQTIKWEKGAEYGFPTPQRVAPTRVVQGLPIYNYKAMTQWTREYLVFAKAEDIRRETAAYVYGDYELQWRRPLQELFDNYAGTTKSFTDPQLGLALTVRSALVNGDGYVPPMFESTTFAGSHDHHFSSGGTTVTTANITTLKNALDEHGLRGQRVLYINAAQEADIRALTDFVGVRDPLVDYSYAVTAGPFADLPPQPLGSTVIGVIKNTGFTVIRWNLIPASYMLAYDTSGPKPVARREFPNGHPLRGLNLIRPDVSDSYPLEQVYFERWVGFAGNAGTARLNGAAMYVSASAYTVPSIDATAFRTL